MSPEEHIKALTLENQRIKKAVADFLVPHRHRLAECWLQHFVDVGAVTFDSIGFVRPTPTPEYTPPCET